MSNLRVCVKHFWTHEGKMTASDSRREKRKLWHKVNQKKKKGGSQALAAGEFVAPLPIHGWGDTYVYYIVAWRIFVCRSVWYLLLRYDTVDFCENALECFFYVSGVQGWSFNKWKSVLFCECSGLISGHGPEMSKVALVSNQHDDDVVVSVVPQLLQPAVHILVRQVLRNIIN